MKLILVLLDEISGGLVILEYYVLSLMNYLFLEACQLSRNRLFCYTHTLHSLYQSK